MAASSQLMNGVIGTVGALTGGGGVGGAGAASSGGPEPWVSALLGLLATVIPVMMGSCAQIAAAQGGGGAPPQLSSTAIPPVGSSAVQLPGSTSPSGSTLPGSALAADPALLTFDSATGDPGAEAPQATSDPQGAAGAAPEGEAPNEGLDTSGDQPEEAALVGPM